MTYDELRELRALVDDLCLVASGWRTNEQHDAYMQSFNRVAQRGNEVKRQCEIERLKARIQELEGKAP